MIAFKNGIVVLIDDETDEEPVVIQTELKKITKTQWEVNGLYIAILGELNDNEPIKYSSYERIYTCRKLCRNTNTNDN